MLAISSNPVAGGMPVGEGADEILFDRSAELRVFIIF